MPNNIFLIVHNVRSCYNVGSLLRTADTMGVSWVYLTGYTPYPKSAGDTRPPHIADKMDRQISKTALGAEKTLDWEHAEDVFAIIEQLKKKGAAVAALEQTDRADPLPGFKSKADIALIVGREVEGLEEAVLQKADIHLEIPMLGNKESLNVASAGAIALYHLRFVAPA